MKMRPAFVSWHRREAGERLDREDLYLALSVTLFSVILNLFQLGSLEFFRHTEADRTLIAWEMHTTGELIIPHLLGSPILTKPPIFYWLIALSIALFGGVSEFVARFPSAIAGALLVAVQYVSVRLATGARTQATVSALVLATSMVFLLQASVAEIDMVFALFCASTLYALFFFIRRPRPSVALLVAGLCALAFLTKGPPVLFFGGAAFVAYLAYEGRGREYPWRKLVLNTGVGLGAFLLLASLWLTAVAHRVGWPELIRQWDAEIFQRVISPSHSNQGPFFYLPSVFLGLLPWSGFLFATPFIKRSSLSERGKGFLLFNALSSGLAVVMLSLAAGKSTRYLFPLYPFLANLAVTGLMVVGERKLGKKFFQRGALSMIALLGFVIALSVVTPIVIALLPELHTKLPGLTAVGLFFALSLFCAPLFLGLRGFKDQSLTTLFLSLVLLMVTVRIAERTVYVPLRNATRTVIPLAQQIHDRVPAGQPIYTVEMFERWVVFYLKLLGRDVYRITPELESRFKDSSEPLYLLLTFEEESWRILQLRQYTEQAKLIAEPQNRQNHLLLLQVPANVTPYLETSPTFPTYPSAPFSYEYSPPNPP